jgi:dTDP-4-dehydrorhamnose reductase
MKILLLGGNGQVGHELRRALAPLGDVVPTTRSGMLADGTECEAADFDRPRSMMSVLQRVQPDLVVNAAAYTAVDRAEDDADAAFRANAEAPELFSRWCAERGVPFVHYSTDYVFDGVGTLPYQESHATGPLGIYGRSKLAGEEAVRAAGGQHLIFRTAWVYASHGANFLRTMLRVGAEREELRVVADQIGSPTPAAMIADVTAQVLGQGTALSGTWHLTASGQTSWHGFAEAIFAEAVQAGVLQRAPRVTAIASSEYPTPAKRPAWSVLDNRRLQEDFVLVLPSWQEGLHRVISEFPRNV